MIQAERFKGPSQESRLVRLIMWAPLPVVFGLMIALRFMNPPGLFYAPNLLLILDLVFSLLMSLLIVLLFDNSFLRRHAYVLVMLVAAVLIWGLADVIALAFGGGDLNNSITIHNLCVCASSGFYLISAFYLRTTRNIRGQAGIWIVSAVLIAVGVVALIVVSTRLGLIPLFFIQNKGGTPAREIILISSAAMFVGSAFILGGIDRNGISMFASWFRIGLLLIALGFMGTMLEPVHGGVLDWTGRFSQFLGGLYFLFAIRAVRGESNIWGIPLRKELEESEERFAAAFENGGVPMAITTTNGVFTKVNPAFCRMLGCGESEIVGRGFADFTYSADLPVNLVKAQELYKDGKPFQMEKRYVRKDGGVIWADVTSAAVRGSDGKPLYVITHIQDITKRVVAENRLKDQEEKFRAVYENINDAIMMVDIENGRYVDCNQMMLDLTGFTRDEICAMKAGELLARPGSSVVPLNIEKIRTLGKLRGESEIISKNGVSIPVEYATSLITIGTAQFMVSVIRDITEQKKVEKILKRDKATFERLVEERTRELSEIRINLERSKRLSDIGTLGAIIAHELRNPLSAIRMATHNIRRNAKNPDLDRHLAGIETKIIESDQIIENLLFYTRLKPPQYDRVPIFDLIENIVESITEKCQDKISINKNIEKLKGLFVECDPTQIKEVIINILNNAMDALVHKEGEIKVSAENQDNHVEIVVKDNGVGIDKNVLKKVYDPFFTTKVKGTGLGLLVVRQVLEFHGGSVNIESEPGMGTSVNVQIPKKRINGCQASL